MLVYKKVGGAKRLKNGKNRVDLAIFPGGCSGDYWTGDGFRLMANALKF